MSDDPYELAPAFLSPLTHDQHARIGRIALLWGQVDMILDQLLESALGITSRQRKALIGDKQIGGKLDLLNNNLDGIKGAKAKALAKEFRDLANQTKPHRNKCFHGIWGFAVGRKKGDVSPAATHYRSIENPLRVTQLPALERKLCKTSRVGMNALVELHELSEKVKACNRLFHGKSENRDTWLREWIAQHPLDDDALDRRWKRGQLPYLKKPL